MLVARVFYAIDQAFFDALDTLRYRGIDGFIDSNGNASCVFHEVHPVLSIEMRFPAQ
jgi:hypothetical protein